jgi:hypothetical protein
LSDGEWWCVVLCGDVEGVFDGVEGEIEAELKLLVTVFSLHKLHKA